MADVFIREIFLYIAVGVRPTGYIRLHEAVESAALVYFCLICRHAFFLEIKMLWKKAVCLSRLCGMQIRRRFHKRLSPVKPGLLVVDSPVNLTITPAQPSEDLVSCLTEVTFTHAGKIIPVPDLLKTADIIDMEDMELNTLLKVLMPGDLDIKDQDNLTMNICIPRHYGKLNNQAVTSALVFIDRCLVCS